MSKKSDKQTPQKIRKYIVSAAWEEIYQFDIKADSLEAALKIAERRMREAGGGPVSGGPLVHAGWSDSPEKQPPIKVFPVH